MLVRAVLALLVWSACADWSKVNDLFVEAIRDRVFPGGSVTVANETHILYRKSFGQLSYTYQIHDVEVSNSTKYDIASVTKVMATTFGVMHLYNSGYLKLTELVSKYVPNYDVNKKGNTTIANLLLHNSGLKYDYPGALPKTPEDVWEYITFAKPDFPVGTQFQYSNLGFQLLSKIVANVSRQTFESYFKQNAIFAGFKNTNFNPPQSEWHNIAPTEYDAGTRRPTQKYGNASSAERSTNASPTFSAASPGTPEFSPTPTTSPASCASLSPAENSPASLRACSRRRPWRPSRPAWRACPTAARWATGSGRGAPLRGCTSALGTTGQRA
jgi:CubicO group peptidase (beta-lactamase class C family)